MQQQRSPPAVQEADWTPPTAPHAGEQPGCWPHGTAATQPGPGLRPPQPRRRSGWRAAHRRRPPPPSWLQLELEQVAGAYANALVEVAQKTSSLEAVHADVDTLSSVLKDNAVRHCRCCRRRRCLGAARAGASPRGAGPACGSSTPTLAFTGPCPMCARGLASLVPHTTTTTNPALLSSPAFLQAVLELLSNPVIAEGRKKDVVKRLASEASFSQYTVNFLNLLIDQNRIEALENICESFEKSYCALTDTQARAALCAGALAGGARAPRGEGRGTRWGGWLGGAPGGRGWRWQGGRRGARRGPTAGLGR